MTVLRGDAQLDSHRETHEYSGWLRAARNARYQYALMLGHEVTVGHSVTPHGCTIQPRVLVGMGCAIF